MEKGEAAWVVVTNGRLWRLYSQRTHARATNYYEIDLEEVLSQSGPHAPEINVSFRYFWILFRSEAFHFHEVDREGKKQSLSLLDQLLLYSEDYAKGLGERLKERVFADIFPHLGAGFIHYIRERDAVDAEISQGTLDAVYQGTLTLLYRLLFLLYAESRDLLPVKEARDYFEASISQLKREIADAAETIEDAVEEKLKKRYRDDEYQLYDRLCRLFRVVDEGDAALNMPVYNGGLFVSDPNEKDDNPEASAARFLKETKVPDRFLAHAIDLLARDVEPKRQDLVPIDFKSLGVRQLGSIYEGLLEFKLHIADRRLAVVKEKGRKVYVPFNDLEKKEQERAERQERIKKKGEVYLENDKHERKAPGSYYTPDHIVQYIVEHAVGPVLKEKFDAMRSKLREAQQKRRAFFDKQEALRKQGLRAEPESKAEFIGQELVDELFNIKVLDMAMGSGHFLVETVDYITDKMLDFLNGFPWNPVIAHLSRMRETILQEMEDQGITIDPKRLTDVNLLKRHVLKRCIYGVDINPMAVELAKVSLWLDCFTLGAPLSFLDHHLRCGNSLIGATVEEVDKIRAAKGQLLLSASSDWQGLLQAIQGMIEVGGLPDVTSAQVTRSRTAYKSALSNLENFKKILDVHTARWFVELPNGKNKGKKAKPKEDPFDYILRSGDLFDWSHGKKAPLLDVEPYRTLLSECARVAKEKCFFHWELEFPEVFYGPRPGTTQAIQRLEGAGFDAVIGNPPYVRVQELRQSDPSTAEFLGLRYRSAVKNFDIYLPFFEIGLSVTKGQVSYIAPNKWFATDYGEGIRRLVREQKALARVVDFGDFQLFPDATNYTCIASLSRKPKDSFAYVDASSGEIGREESLPMKTLSSDGRVWSFARGPEAALLEKLMNGPFPVLKDLRDRAFQGLRTSDNDVYVLRAAEPSKKGLMPVLSRATGEVHQIETPLLKPLLSGEDIRAFSLLHRDQWILLPYDLSGPEPALFSEKRLRGEYPGGWRYLKACEARLRARERGRMDGPDWWAYIYPKNLDQFEQPKVMLPGYNDKPSAGLDIEGRFYHVSGYSITLKKNAPIDLACLVCLLNSDLLYWFLMKTGVALQRGFAEFRPQYLDGLPIALPDKQGKQRLLEIAQKALQTGYESVKPDLNKIAWRLYDLTEQEVAVVESKK